MLSQAESATGSAQAAPVSLFGDDLDAVPGILRLGRATRRIIYANIFAAVSTKVRPERPHLGANGPETGPHAECHQLGILMETSLTRKCVSTHPMASRLDR